MPASCPPRPARFRRFALAACAVAIALVSGCASSWAARSRPAGDEDLARLADYLTGWFDSAEQAARAPEDFRHIRLVMIPIWPQRTDGRWLYVEQAAASALDRPYRQRVYRVHRDDDGVLRSDVYELPGDALPFAACWNSPQPLGDVEPRDLTLRDGCSVLMEPNPDGAFAGATFGTACASTLRGAAYATSEVTVWRDRLVSWDRGWNAAGAQVWGATRGGYEFVKRGAGPPRPGLADPQG